MKYSATQVTTRIPRFQNLTEIDFSSYFKPQYLKVTAILIWKYVDVLEPGHYIRFDHQQSGVNIV